MVGNGARRKENRKERKGRKRMIQKIPLGSTSITEARVPFRYINGENDETYIGNDDGSILIRFGKLSAAGTSLLISLLATGHIREERLCMAAVIGMGGDKDEATRYASRPATVTPMDSIATDEGSLALLAIVAGRDTCICRTDARPVLMFDGIGMWGNALLADLLVRGFIFDNEKCMDAELAMMKEMYTCQEEDA